MKLTFIICGAMNYLNASLLTTEAMRVDDKVNTLIFSSEAYIQDIQGQTIYREVKLGPYKIYYRHPFGQCDRSYDIYYLGQPDPVLLMSVRDDKLIAFFLSPGIDWISDLVTRCHLEHQISLENN